MIFLKIYKFCIYKQSKSQLGLRYKFWFLNLNWIIIKFLNYISTSNYQYEVLLYLNKSVPPILDLLINLFYYDGISMLINKSNLF